MVLEHTRLFINPFLLRISHNLVDPLVNVIGLGRLENSDVRLAKCAIVNTLEGRWDDIVPGLGFGLPEVSFIGWCIECCFP